MRPSTSVVSLRSKRRSGSLYGFLMLESTRSNLSELRIVPVEPRQALQRGSNLIHELALGQLPPCRNFECCGGEFRCSREAGTQDMLDEFSIHRRIIDDENLISRQRGIHVPDLGTDLIGWTSILQRSVPPSNLCLYTTRRALERSE